MKTRKEIYTEYLRSEHWKQLREEAFKEYGKKCFIHKKRKERLDVHHVRYRENLEDCTVEDVVPLCRECHTEAHSLIGRLKRVNRLVVKRWAKKRLVAKRELNRKPKKRKKGKPKLPEIENPETTRERVDELIKGTLLRNYFTDDNEVKRITLTQTVITSYFSVRGGISHKKLKLLGVPIPLPGGWKRKLKGLVIDYSLHLMLIDEERYFMVNRK